MRSWATVWLLLCLSGCSRSCKNDRPYVPYSIGEGGGEDAAGGATSTAELGPDASTPLVLGTPAPVGATRWSLEGLELVAPPERSFVYGLAHDLDGDGARDAVAIVRSGEGAADEVLFYKGTANGIEGAVPLASAPAAFPAEADAGCARVVRLAQVGRRSVAVELGASCASRAASRWIGVFAFHRGARLHFAATVTDPESMPRLTIDVDGADQDGDGIDDVVLRLTLDAPSAPFEPMPRVSARLAWFDRPAGLSRAPEEPDASLRTAAQAATAKAARAKDAPGVPAIAHQVRALYAAICADTGAARIGSVSVGDGTVACGPSRALEEAGFAAVRAYTTMGDPSRAAAALELAQVAPATHTQARATEALAWLGQAAPPQVSQKLSAIAAVPLFERGASPAWGPLAFEPSGKLLVRTAAGTVRVDPATADERDAPDVPPWRTHVVAPDGVARWLDVLAACGGAPLRARFTASAGPEAEVREALLPIQSPLSARCTKGAMDPVRVVPLSWGPRGLEAIVAGEPLLFATDLSRASLAAGALDQPTTPGSARSPSGKALAVATSIGIFVRTAKWRTLKAKELDGGYGELVGCTPSDDGTMVACVRGGRAFVGTWEAP